MLAEWFVPPVDANARTGPRRRSLPRRRLPPAPGAGGGPSACRPPQYALHPRALLARLGLPVARLEPSLDHDRAALVEVLAAALGLLAPHDHGQEAGLLALLSALGRIVPVDRQPQIGHRSAAGGIPELGSARQVADQEYPVQARHQTTSSTAGVCGLGADRIRLRTGTRVVKCRSTCSFSVSCRSYSLTTAGTALHSITA